MTLDEIKALQANIRGTFSSPQGEEVMRFMETIGGWTPTIGDSMETNAIIARDANRRLLGTLKTFINCSPDQIQALIERG